MRVARLPSEFTNLFLKVLRRITWRLQATTNKRPQFLCTNQQNDGPPGDSPRCGPAFNAPLPTVPAPCYALAAPTRTTLLHVAQTPRLGARYSLTSGNRRQFQIVLSPIPAIEGGEGKGMVPERPHGMDNHKFAWKRVDFDVVPETGLCPSQISRSASAHPATTPNYGAIT